MADKKIIVIYHGGCRDGFGGAWAARKKFGNRAEYIPAFDRFAPPRGLKGKEIYLIDYGYSADTTKTLIRENRRVTAIDHHITAKSVAKLTKDYLFSLHHSGAALAWNYFHPGKKIPFLLRYVEDIDLWSWKMPHAKEIVAIIDLADFHFAAWDKLANDLESANKRKEHIVEGKLLLRHERAILEELLPSAEQIRFAGRTAFAINAPRHFVDDLGHILAKKSHSFAAVWRKEDGVIRVSLRSAGSVDVAKIAQKFGGGGHRASAAFTLDAGGKLPWKIISKK